MSGRTIGVTLPIPAPYGSRLDVVRAQFGPDAHEMPAHVTVLPPIDVDDEVLPEVVAHLAAVAASTAPFRLVLSGVDSFRPVSPVVFVVGGLILLATWSVVLLFLASLRATNWSVLALDTGLWLNVRSYANHHFPPETARAAFIPYAEIASARRVRERFPRIARSKRSLPDSCWLELTLVHKHTDALHAAVEEERTRLAPERKFLGITSRSRQIHTTCFVLRPGVVRVEWLGGGLLRELGRHVRVEPTLEYELGGEVEARAIEFLRRGDPISATQLLHVERGLGLREAKDRLAELDAERRAA